MSTPQPSRVQLKNKSVMIDGVPHVIFSGEMQQYRLPASEWRDRMEKTAALGLNGIGVYAGWNFHSPEPGVYDFTGDRDLGKFLDEAHRVGLKVLARPGPYVCNEWDLGGFPGWLLREDSCDWRTAEPSHLEYSREWYEH
ncbi:MAG: beta-galactosidase, partial [Phycisphaerae bacterium]